ncbi:MAG: bacillithiol system redox-active protein YtxJ [Crocinitomicaceae bacterium]|nr:bacillithiol system redox-active protein YtxJ [Crocinitomicaceae bacterium]
MSWFKETKSALVWNFLESLEDLQNAIELSDKQPVLLYKHSNRCSICSMSKNRLELYWDVAYNIQPFFLDVIKNRDLSNEIENQFGIKHESPQALLIRNRKCVYHASHGDINFNELKTHI